MSSSVSCPSRMLAVWCYRACRAKAQARKKLAGHRPVSVQCQRQASGDATVRPDSLWTDRIVYTDVPCSTPCLGLGFAMPTNCTRTHTHTHTNAQFTTTESQVGTLRSRHGGKSVRLQICSGIPLRGAGLHCISDLTVGPSATVYSVQMG